MAMNERSKPQAIPVRIITAAIPTERPRIVNDVRAFRFSMFRAMNVENRMRSLDPSPAGSAGDPADDDVAHPHPDPLVTATRQDPLGDGPDVERPVPLDHVGEVVAELE